MVNSLSFFCHLFLIYDSEINQLLTLTFTLGMDIAISIISCITLMITGKLLINNIFLAFSGNTLNKISRKIYIIIFFSGFVYLVKTLLLD